ncbi:MAG TPA: hypothetical protein VJS20_08800, partial [Gemmatimonadales bacterium]|nr:hypothetical protein [Gemmatimonadales bacterium]
MIRLKLGWSNPDTGPTSLRLYALDQGDQPRWAQPHARVAEVPLIEAGAKEGERYVLLAAEEYEVIRKIQDTRDALITTRDGYYAEIDHRREL